MLVLGLVEVPWWVLLITAIVIYLGYASHQYNFFKKQGIPCAFPLPPFGTMYMVFLRTVIEGEFKAREIAKEKGKGCVGVFLGSTPFLVVHDEELLSAIMVKEFSAFTNRMKFDTGTISDYMLTNLDDHHWKLARNEMTPTFTTGKLKRMNTEINRCAKGLADSLLEPAKLGETVEMKEYTGGYTMDVIASTAFGIRVESQKDRNNAFIINAKKAFQFDFMKKPILFLRFVLPTFNKLLIKLGYPFNITPKEARDFFYDISRQTFEMRKEDIDQSRSDFLQLMIKAQRGENIADGDEDQDASTQGGGLSTDEILANAMLFFIAGYDTTSTALSFFMYSMAVNPECQDRLIEEIDRVVGEKDFVDYNLLQGMTYMDQCINETLRLYPPAMAVNRVVNTDVTINGILFKKGMTVAIPIFAIQRDPDKWPEPDKFDPERFSAENKKDRNPYHFIPFGNGPRNCIGMRLALNELKVAVTHVFKKIRVSKCDKTHIPMKFANSPGLLKPEGGIWLKVEQRKKD